MAGASIEAVKELLVQGEDPSQEDEVGRGAPEAAVLYCDCEVQRKSIQYLEICKFLLQVIKHVLEFCTTNDNKMEINKDLLLEIANDHSYPEQVKDIIERICK